VWSTGIPRSRDDEAPENVTGIPRSRDDEALENAAARISTLERMNRCAAFAPQHSPLSLMSMVFRQTTQWHSFRKVDLISTVAFGPVESHDRILQAASRTFCFVNRFFLFRQRGLSHAHPLAGLAVEAARRK
jgi:hypothetical protein